MTSQPQKVYHPRDGVDFPKPFLATSREFYGSKIKSQAVY